MTRTITTLLLYILLSTVLIAAGSQEEKIKTQNIEVVKMAAKEMTSKLPQKVDAFTQLVTIEAKEENLIYTFEIQTEAKSDETIIRESKERNLKKRIENGICKSSERFLKSGIKITYLYLSAISKKSYLLLRRPTKAAGIFSV